MERRDEREKVVGVTAFKARCLALIDDVAKGKASRVLLLRRNRPVAALVPIEERFPDLWGAMRGTVTVPAGTDPTRPSDEVWKAEV